MLIWQSQQPFTAGRSKTWPRLAAKAVWALAFLYAAPSETDSDRTQLWKNLWQLDTISPAATTAITTPAATLS